MCKFFRNVYGFYFTNQNLCIFRNFHTCKFCNLICRFSRNLVIQCSIYNNRLTNLIKLFSFFQEVAASVCKFFLYFIVNAVQNRYGLLRCTDHTVVKCFGMNDGVNCKFNICCVINNNRCISGSNSKCWFSGRISCLYHSRTTRCKDDIRFFHDHIGQFQ